MRNRKDSDPEAVQPRGEIGIIPHRRGREGRVGETYLQNETKSTLMGSFPFCILLITQQIKRTFLKKLYWKS